MWLDVLRATALVLVIEGIMPFISPSSSRAVFARLCGLDDRILRLVGLSSMIAGVAALQLLRWLA
jgi:uncharacterized protein YjeT (DUF2065 family)